MFVLSGNRSGGPTSAKEDAMSNMTDHGDDSPELTDADFARARPFPEMFPELARKKAQGGGPGWSGPRSMSASASPPTWSKASRRPARATMPASSACCGRRWSRGSCDGLACGCRQPLVERVAPKPHVACFLSHACHGTMRWRNARRGRMSEIVGLERIRRTVLKARDAVREFAGVPDALRCFQDNQTVMIRMFRGRGDPAGPDALAGAAICRAAPAWPISTGARRSWRRCSD